MKAPGTQASYSRVVRAPALTFADCGSFNPYFYTQIVKQNPMLDQSAQLNSKALKL